MARPPPRLGAQLAPVRPVSLTCARVPHRSVVAWLQACMWDLTLHVVVRLRR